MENGPHLTRLSASSTSYGRKTIKIRISRWSFGHTACTFADIVLVRYLGTIQNILYQYHKLETPRCYAYAHGPGRSAFNATEGP